MHQGEAKQPRRGRCFQCLTPARSGAAVPGRSEKAGALVVLGAGSRNFNGVYLYDGTHTGNWTDGDRYCKRNGTEALTYYNGWWLFTADGLGESCYGAPVSSAAAVAPPQRGWCVKHGKEPAPSAEPFATLAEVPRELRDSDESCALEVCGAGSTEFDGVYRLCGLQQSQSIIFHRGSELPQFDGVYRFCYRKDDGDESIIFHRGWWLMNENGCGETAYGLRCDKSAAAPPSGAAWEFKKGKAPAPTVKFHMHQEAAMGSAVASGMPTEPSATSATSLSSALHAKEPRLEELMDPQVCKGEGSWTATSVSGTLSTQDGSVDATSASGSANKEHASWASSSAIGTMNLEADAPRRRAVKVSESSSTIVPVQDSVACEPAVVSVVVPGARAAAPASTLPGSALEISNEQRLEEFVDTQACKEDASLATTSASETVDREHGSLFSASASGSLHQISNAQRLEELVALRICKEVGSLASTSASGAMDGSLASSLASRILNKEDGCLSSLSANGTVNQGNSFLASGSVTQEADLDVVPGLVSQRLTEFAKLSQGTFARSFAAAECMPDPGLVSQRIQQHQKFINQT